MGETFNWLPDVAVMDRRNYATVTRVEIKVSDHIPADQVVILPCGETIMGHAKYAELMKRVHQRVNDSITGAILGKPNPITNPQPTPDPEKEAMQNNELWGAF